MRRFQHWNWQYANDRARLLLYTLTHPGSPWLTPQANQFLAQHTKPGTTIFEWGAGRSTIWLAKRGATIQSIETDPTWHTRVTKQLQKHNLTNATLILLDPQQPNQYTAPIHEHQDQSLDIIIVDGISELRDQCALAALPKIKPSGFILIDDAHRYVPAKTNAPNALPPNATPPTPAWKEFLQHVSNWNLVRSTSGITDTAIWKRPS